MILLLELSVYGELFFFEDTLTLTQYNNINKFAHSFFKKYPEANIDLFINDVYKNFNIKLSQLKVHKVISI